MYQLNSEYKPTGDQPQAIEALTRGLEQGLKHQVLLGVTGSGKTFTMANIIKNAKRPALIIAHNKTLAAQLAAEFREFFPDNAVGYFVSYYDYYQPEAYIPSTEKGFLHPDRMPLPGDCFDGGHVAYHLREGTHFFSRTDWRRYLCLI